MKTKLLKKIRKHFVVEYFEDKKYYKYRLTKKYYWNIWFSTKEECLEYLLLQLRRDYKKYSRKYKKVIKNKPVKVWYV